jgi:hypothetical protein
MLGEQVSEFNGKITGQRVLDVEGPTMETSVAASGNLKGIQASETITFMAKVTSNGILHGVGNGWWISPRRMIESYANLVSSFAGNTLRTTQLVNNSMLTNMDAFKKTVDQARESSNDLARACMNFTKKIERDSLDVSDNNTIAQDNVAENAKTLKMRKT